MGHVNYLVPLPPRRSSDLKYFSGVKIESEAAHCTHVPVLLSQLGMCMLKYFRRHNQQTLTARQHWFILPATRSTDAPKFGAARLTVLARCCRLR